MLKTGNNRPAFREYAIFFHDEMEIKNKDGETPTDPHTGMPNGTMAISYRAEPMRNREPLDLIEDVLTGEDISMSSWVYGDPAPPLPKAYVGDPAKFRLIHGGIKETHVFHLHNHQWRLEPDDPNSTIIDSISISPQECYTLDILYGAGSLNRTIGDVIFHCHLYPHFMEGMWTLWRIFDRLQDGSGVYPDGTAIQALMPLKDRPAPPVKDTDHPGYPNNYSFSGWTTSGITAANTASISINMPPNSVSLRANFTYVGPGPNPTPTPSRDSDSGGSGSSKRDAEPIVNPRPATMAEALAAYNAALKTAKETGGDTVKPSL